MSALSRFEGLIEGMFEDSVARLFRTRLQPAEIARRLERAMETQQSISVNRVLVPNYYKVFLNTEDYAVFEPYKADLEREMAGYLVELARERSFTLMHQPRVELSPDQAISKRQIQILAENQAPPDIAGGHTQVIPSVGSGQQRPQPRAKLILMTDQGQHTFPIDATQVTMGRALNNHIVLEDSRVSRHHAEIVYKGRRFRVCDMGSTNGTYVNGEPITEQPLQSGDIISLGGLELRFQEG